MAGSGTQNRLPFYCWAEFRDITDWTMRGSEATLCLKGTPWKDNIGNQNSYNLGTKNLKTLLN
jgi:hypothetical protein